MNAKGESSLNDNYNHCTDDGAEYVIHCLNPADHTLRQYERSRTQASCQLSERPASTPAVCLQRAFMLSLNNSGMLASVCMRRVFLLVVCHESMRPFVKHFMEHFLIVQTIILILKIFTKCLFDIYYHFVLHDHSSYDFSKLYLKGINLQVQLLPLLLQLGQL